MGEEEEEKDEGCLWSEKDGKVKKVRGAGKWGEGVGWVIHRGGGRCGGRRGGYDWGGG